MRIALPLIAMMLFGPVAALAQSGTRVVQHRAVDFLQGEFEGVAVDADGALVTAPVSQTRCFTPALYIWSMAFDRDGRVLAGTGDDGGVVREDGETFAEIAKLPGELVMAVADAGSGVLAATGPEGRIRLMEASAAATATPEPPRTGALAAMAADPHTAVPMPPSRPAERPSPRSGPTRADTASVTSMTPMSPTRPGRGGSIPRGMVRPISAIDNESRPCAERRSPGVRRARPGRMLPNRIPSPIAAAAVESWDS